MKTIERNHSLFRHSIAGALLSLYSTAISFATFSHNISRILAVLTYFILFVSDTPSGLRLQSSPEQNDDSTNTRKIRLLILVTSNKNAW